MAKEAVFSLKLEPELRADFMAEAEAADRPASQVVREFMRDYVRRQRGARDHDSWFLAEVETGIAEADDPNIRRISSEEIAARWRVRRAELLKRIGDSEG
jgi:predicted transcriptional regulator